MAPSLVQSKSATAASTSPVAVTLTSNTTAGNCLIVSVVTSSSPNPTVTGITIGGSADNFAQAATVGNPSVNGITTSIWADPNCAGGQTAVSVTLSAASGSVCVMVMEWSGLAASSVADQSAGQALDTGVTSWTSTATGTTTQASEVAIGAVGGFNSAGVGTISGPSSPWVNQSQVTSASTHVGLLTGYDILSSTGTVTYSGTLPAGASYGALVVTFKAAPPAPAAPFQLTANRARRPYWPRRGTGSVMAGKFTAPPSAVAQPPFPLTANRARRPYWPRKGTGLVVPGKYGPPPVPVPQPPFPLTANRARRPYWPRRGVTSVQPGVPATLPAPAVAGTWSGSYAAAAGFVFPTPAAVPVQVSVMNTAGDWLFALVTWRPSTTGADVSVAVADDAHNWWEPVGAPSADSGAAGAVRTSLWAAPAARVANSVTGITQVQVAPTGPVLSLAALIVDMSGLLPWYQAAAITGGFANAATSLSVSAAAPSAQAVEFAVFGSDNNSLSVTGPAGWTTLPTVTASNGADTTADIRLTPAWRITSAGTTASVSSSGTIDLAGTIAGVLVSAPAPVQPNPAWPVMITEAAPGAGVQVPPSETAWVSIAARSLSLSVKQGKQYSQGALSAGQGTIEIDSPDGATIPPGTGIFTGIDSGTPLRRRVIIPQLRSPHYVAFAGYFRRWPWQADPAMYRGKTVAEVTDIWGYAAGPLNSMAIEEILLDSPYALWPATDPAGSTGASNVAPGNSLPLTQAASKYGTGGATAAFGGSSGLVGASSAQVTASGTGGGGTGSWTQKLTGNSLAYNGYGYALQCADANYPAVSGGVTVETWAGCTLNAAIAGVNGNTVFVATSGVSPAFAVGSNAFPNGMPVVLSVAGGFTFPSPFSAGTTYYVVNAAGNGGNFDLAATQGGTAIACTASGDGFITAVLAWNPVIMSLRDGKGTVYGLSIRNTDGALLLLQRNGTSVTATVADSGHDYRSFSGHFSLAATQTAWRLLVNAGGTLTAAGTFSPPLPATFREACFGGVQDATSQGYAMPGTIEFPAVIPGFSPQVRVVNRWWAASAGLSADGATGRTERILEYAGLAGRRWIGQQNTLYEGDLVASGRDIGGQPAASSAGNIAASTLPAQLYIAPTGDITYLSKIYAWNQPVRWVLGDSTAGGEVPFLPGSLATDYDPTRVSAPVQVTSLDTQYVTVPSGSTSSTTMAAVTAAAGRQYGGQPYQSTSYLNYDASSQYTAGGSSVDLANWVANVYRRPQNRVQAVTVEAAANAANASSQRAWAFWAGCSVGDMVQVNVRMPTASTSPLISLVARVTQTQRDSQFSQDGTSAKITATLDFAPEYNTLTCDDPIRGLLNGTNVMGW